MPDHSTPRFVEGLPEHPITVEAVTEMGHAATDGIHGTMPIESEFNDVVTEFLLYLDERICALVFDPELERWVVLENRPFAEASFPDVEAELMDRLYEWRQEHVIPYLAANDLIPTFVITPDDTTD